MRLLVTGGTGALGRAFVPAAAAAGHEVTAPRHAELDLFDPAAVTEAARDADAIVHLASRIRPLDKLDDPPAWNDNDRLRAEASRILVDAALVNGTQAYLQPTVTFGYPKDAPATEDTPFTDVSEILRSAVEAERQTARFAGAGRRGVVLRLGLLDGPNTGNDEPIPMLGATLHVADAADALLAALEVPSGIYNVCRDGERVANQRFQETTGWRAQR
jgi:nucleoside-diphosphate-sugar epimerase